MLSKAGGGGGRGSSQRASVTDRSRHLVTEQARWTPENVLNESHDLTGPCDTGSRGWAQLC